MTEQQKALIDSMDRYELCRVWRFAKSGVDPLIQGDTGDYLVKRFREAGGFSPEISRRLGWEG